MIGQAVRLETLPVTAKIWLKSIAVVISSIGVILALYIGLREPAHEPVLYTTNLSDLGKTLGVTWDTRTGGLLIEGDTLAHFDVASNDYDTRFDGSNSCCGFLDFAFNPSNGTLAIADYMGVRIVDPNTNQVIREVDFYMIQFQILTGINWSPNYDRLLVSSTGGPPRSVIRIYDTQDYNLISELNENNLPYTINMMEFGDGYSDAVWHPTQPLIAISPNWDSFIAIVDPDTGEEYLRLDAYPKAVRDMEWSSTDPSILGALYYDETIVIYDTSTGELLSRFDANSTLTSIAFGPNPEYVAVAHAGGAFIWNWVSGMTRPLINIAAYDIAWSNADQIAVAYDEGVFLFEDVDMFFSTPTN
jgi:WD40 repeat protein